MSREVNGAVLIRAVKHPANYKALIFCSASLIAAGMVLIILGIVFLIVDYVELGPPHYDAQYSRYAGTSLGPIVGPMFIAFGTLMIIGNLIMVVYVSISQYKRNNRTNSTSMRHSIGSSHGVFISST